jgi:non-ribosomal peptide synthetase component E (peptide arylation enzyme)
MPDTTALVAHRVSQQERRSFSYRELNRIVERMAAGMASLGVNKADVVSCQLPNWWQMTALHLACVRIGAVFNPLMPIFREHELRFMLKHAQSRVLVVPQTFRGFDYAAMVDGLRDELPALEQVLIIDGSDETRCFQRVLLDHASASEQPGHRVHGLADGTPDRFSLRPDDAGLPEKHGRSAGHLGPGVRRAGRRPSDRPLPWRLRRFLPI